jgi:hypothetical protein
VQRREQRDRLVRGGAETAALAAMLVPGALTVALAFQSGGFEARATAVAAIEAIVLLAVWLILAERPFASVTRLFVVAIAALLALAGWSALSELWSVSAERAASEVVRDLLYAATLALFALTATTARRTRMLALGLAGAFVIVCAAALASRLLPALVEPPLGYPLERLAYPISYWNGLGLLAAIGIVLCLQFTCGREEPPWAHRLGAAAIPLLVATLYATQSRAATVAAILGVVLYLALARPAGVLAVAAAVVPPSAGAAIAVELAGTPDPGVASAATVEAVAVAVCLCGAAVAREVLPPLLVGVRPPRKHRAIGVGALAIVVATLVLVAVVGAGRGSSGRFHYWRAALATAADSPLLGSGAGTYELEWARRRDTPRLSVRDAHSLYLETPAELGLVGFGLLALTLSAVAVGAVRRFRAGAADRSVWAALLAGLAIWYAHAAVDWDWELPAISLWVFAVGGAALAKAPGPAVGSRGSRRTTIATWTILVVCLGMALYSARLALASSRLGAAVGAAEADACPTAEAEAHESLRWREASGPYVIIAWCRLSSDPEAATEAMSRAVQLDPEDWRLRYDFALVLALTGRDAAGEARRAAALNPLHPDVQRAVVAFETGTAEERVAYAARARFLFR